MKYLDNPKLVVTVKLVTNNGVKLLEEFDIECLRSSDGSLKHGDYEIDWGNDRSQVTKLKNFPRWLPALQLVKAVLESALPAKWYFPKSKKIVIPEGFTESGRPYELYCDCGVGHYTIPGYSHGCCSKNCCKNFNLLYPQGNFINKERENKING